MSQSAAVEHDIVPILRAMVTFLAIGFFFLLEAVLHHFNSKVKFLQYNVITSQNSQDVLS
jgi:hypothetical protein